MEAVEVPELGRASILTLMVKQILDRNLRTPNNASSCATGSSCCGSATGG